MIQPVKQGPALVQEIAATQLAPGSVAVWWLGQSGYLIKAPSGTLVIDAYLSEHLTTKYAHTAIPHIRMTTAPVRGGQLRDVDLILATHKHSDHLDPGTLPDLMAASPAAELGLPESLVDHALGLGLDPARLVGLADGRTWTRAGFSVEAIPSAHEGLDTDAQGRHLNLGFVIEVEGLRLYHSGDCVLYPGLAHRLGLSHYDALFLPINGRDHARGVAGNMSAAEAVGLAAEVRPRYLVPHHYDMFTFNTVPIHVFESEARRLPPTTRPMVLRCGDRWVLKAQAPTRMEAQP